MFEPGAKLQLHYPSTTVIQARAFYEYRQIRIHRVRDLLEHPLSPGEFFKRPFIRRSRWLALAWDDTRDCWRNFYSGSAREYESPGDLRLALYEPGGTRPYELLTRGFGESNAERRQLIRAIRHALTIDVSDLQLRVVAADISIRRAG